MNSSLSAFPWSSLLDWYERYGRHDLEWRDYDHDEQTLSYRVWLSEICLQQTQVERVRGYFQKILEQYPTIHDLARASYEEFFPYYQGLGYYSRAKNILKTAKIVSEEYGGAFPREKADLKILPGVGEYTARAILAFGRGEAYLAWDTNLEKVFARYYHGSRMEKLTQEEKNIVEEDFREFIISYVSVGWGIGGGNRSKIISGGENIQHRVATPEAFGTFSHKSTVSASEKDIVRAINNALMDFAATIDLKNPSNIDWESYPIQSGRFYETRGSLESIEIKKSISFPTPDATVIVVLHKDHRVYYSSPVCVIPIIPVIARDDPFSVALRGMKAIHVSRTLDPSPVQDDENQKNGKEYSPFILPPSLSRDTRAYVQDYFREKYGLELSVRPAHKKWISTDGKPYIIMNAQIQTGIYTFDEYSKSEAKLVLDELLSHTHPL